MQIEAGTEINATGKLKGFTFTAFDGRVFLIADTKTSFAAFKKAVNEPVAAVYVKRFFDEREKLTAIMAVVITKEGTLASYYGTPKTVENLLQGLPVIEAVKK